MWIIAFKMKNILKEFSYNNDIYIRYNGFLTFLLTFTYINYKINENIDYISDPRSLHSIVDKGEKPSSYTEAPSDKKVWLFIDPPYFKADQKRAYLHSFTRADHLQLLEVLKKTKHLFCLTYDNCEEIKELYSWAKIYERGWMYHTANSNVTTRKMGRELIISNYEISVERNGNMESTINE